MGCGDIHDEMNEEARKVMNVVKCYDCKKLVGCERIKIQLPSPGGLEEKVVDLCPPCFMKRTKDCVEAAAVEVSPACSKGSQYTPVLQCEKKPHHGLCMWMKCDACKNPWTGGGSDSQGKPLCLVCLAKTKEKGPFAVKTNKGQTYDLLYAHCKACIDVDHMLSRNQDPRDGYCACVCHRVYEAGDMINPRHYGGEDNPTEHVKIALEKGWDKRAFLYNGTKYLWRLGDKPGAAEAEDLEKAIWFLMRELEKVKDLSLRALEMKGKK